MFCVDDVVVIVCEKPLGANVNVYGRIGVIIDIIDEIYYLVKDTTGDDYLYIGSELRDANSEVIMKAFINLVKERI